MNLLFVGISCLIFHSVICASLPVPDKAKKDAQAQRADLSKLEDLQRIANIPGHGHINEREYHRRGLQQPNNQQINSESKLDLARHLAMQRKNLLMDKHLVADFKDSKRMLTPEQLRKIKQVYSDANADDNRQRNAIETRGAENAREAILQANLNHQGGELWNRINHERRQRGVSPTIQRRYSKGGRMRIRITDENGQRKFGRKR